MKEFYEIKQQLRDLIDNGPANESEMFLRKLHDFIVQQDKTLRETKRNSRFKRYIEVGLENLDLHDKVRLLEEENAALKQSKVEA